MGVLKGEKGDQKVLYTILRIMRTQLTGISDEMLWEG